MNSSSRLPIVVCFQMRSCPPVGMSKWASVSIAAEMNTKETKSRSRTRRLVPRISWAFFMLLLQYQYINHFFCLNNCVSMIVVGKSGTDVLVLVLVVRLVIDWPLMTDWLTSGQWPRQSLSTWQGSSMYEWRNSVMGSNRVIGEVYTLLLSPMSRYRMEGEKMWRNMMGWLPWSHTRVLISLLLL